MVDDLAPNSKALPEIEGVEAILARVCALTGMRFAAVARVSELQWVACQVLDSIEFGLCAGDELEIGTTICDEIRQSREGVFIDNVREAPMWRVHPTPVLYGFQSYISVPIFLADGAFFGTLCAIDPEPRTLSLSLVYDEVVAMARAVAAALGAGGIAVPAQTGNSRTSDLNPQTP